MSSEPGPIGIFDSGYGGLTILHGIRQLLPQYDYLYLGDNARAPYGTRSFTQHQQKPYALFSKTIYPSSTQTVESWVLFVLPQKSSAQLRTLAM